LTAEENPPEVNFELVERLAEREESTSAACAMSGRRSFEIPKMC
jgi:hypothetical protein